jgi:hypothetical protein
MFSEEHYQTVDRMGETTTVFRGKIDRSQALQRLDAWNNMQHVIMGSFNIMSLWLLKPTDVFSLYHGTLQCRVFCETGRNKLDAFGFSRWGQFSTIICIFDIIITLSS